MAFCPACERNNMFDLEQSIVDWRRQMIAAGIKTPVPLEELENHLRDEIERQVKSELNEPEAFNSAVQKIGRAHVLQNEFKKVEATREGCNYNLQQALFVIFTVLVPLLIGGMLIFKMGSFSEMASGQKNSGLAAVTAFSLLAWVGRLNYGMFPIIPARQIRDAICISSFAMLMLWWMVLVYIILPRHDFTTGPLVVTVLWGMITPIGAWLGLVWGIEAAAHKKIGRVCR
jgi:hypothetical protein